MELSDDPLSNGKKRWQRTKSWTLGAALIGVSFLPCPDCGMPVAVHAWPFLLLWVVRRWVRRRTRAAFLVYQEEKKFDAKEVE
ncbi:MAG: hypothetical protein ACK44E_01765 [Anaerolineales bacterium]